MVTRAGFTVLDFRLWGEGRGGTLLILCVSEVWDSGHSSPSYETLLCLHSGADVLTCLLVDLASNINVISSCTPKTF